MPQNSVLLIEDDPQYTELVAAVLSGGNDCFEMRSASTLQTGLDAVKRLNPDIILLDLDLPDSAGYETFLRVRAQAPETPIIVLTGTDDDETALKAAEGGVQDYLVKGLQQPKVIARCVKMALHRHSRRVVKKVPLALPELYWG